jgi:hypothetical protein
MRAVSDPKEPGPDEIHHAGSLRTDGKLEARFAAVEPPKPVEEKIELAPRGPKVIQERVDRYRDELRARSRRPWALKLFLFVIVLGVSGLAALLYFKPRLDLPALEGVREATLLDELTAGGEAAPIIISSTPTGATILIGGKVMGQTPWAGENRWRGETLVVVKLPGYRAWNGKLKGGAPTTLDIKLEK